MPAVSNTSPLFNLAAIGQLLREKGGFYIDSKLFQEVVHLAGEETGM